MRGDALLLARHKRAFVLRLIGYAIGALAGRRGGDRRPASIVRAGFGLSTAGMLLLVPVVPRASSGWYLVVPLMIAGAGLGLLVSQLNDYTLAPIEEERVSEAGVNSAGGSFGLSFGLAVADGILLATPSLAFTNKTESSTVIRPAQQEQIADTLEHDAQVVSNTQLDEMLSHERPAVRREVLDINRESTELALQVALLVPILASAIGLFNSFRMLRLPDIEPAGDLEGAVLG
jgi:hypothetical protein